MAAPGPQYPQYPYVPNRVVLVSTVVPCEPIGLLAAVGLCVQQDTAALVVGPTLAAAPGPSVPHRRVDFSEDDEALGPVKGVFDNALNPRVSYADAVGQIPLDLKAELYSVRQFLKSQRCLNALAAAPRLNPDHAAALWLYTCESALYKTLNRLLRARNRAELKAGFFPYLRLLLEAFFGLKTPTRRMVNRGVKRDLAAASAGRYVKGGELVWWGFSSATADIAALQVTDPGESGR